MLQASTENGVRSGVELPHLADLGYRVVAFSRPGYGRTSVAPLMAAEFVPAVAEVCDDLGRAMTEA